MRISDWSSDVCSSDLVPADVDANRARAMAALDLPASALFTNHQVHSATVVVVEEGADPGERLEADGFVTARPGVALGVLAADCAPVLFAAPDDGIIGEIGSASCGERVCKYV